MWHIDSTIFVYRLDLEQGVVNDFEDFKSKFVMHLLHLWSLSCVIRMYTIF